MSQILNTVFLFHSEKISLYQGLLNPGKPVFQITIFRMSQLLRDSEKRDVAHATETLKM